MENIEFVRLEVTAPCSCGEVVQRGEQAGIDAVRHELVCLWCLADLQAGRERPTHRSRRDSVPPVTPVTPPSPPAYVAPFEVRTPQRRGGPGTVGTLLLTVLVLALALWGVPRLLEVRGDAVAGDLPGGLSIGGIDMGRPIAPLDASSTDAIWPPVPADASSSRLLPEVRAQSGSTAYAFIRTVPTGAPVAFDPCRPIRLVVNDSHAPAGSGRLVREAAEAVRAATGLALVIEGQTTEPPTERRAAMDTARYGNRWSPVLVAWGEPENVPGLRGRVAGVAGPVMAPYRSPSEMHFVSGVVLLDAPDFRRILKQRNGDAAAKAIVMHELAHLVGLAHVGDPSQLMFETHQGLAGFADGDLEGLRRLGNGPCFSG